MVPTATHLIIATRLDPDRIGIKIVWSSGHFSVALVIPPIHRQAAVSNYAELVERLLALTKQGLMDPQIVAQLTQEGFHSARRLSVSPRSVHKLRAKHGQVSPLHQHRRSSMVDGAWTVPGLTPENWGGQPMTLPADLSGQAHRARY